MLLLICYISLTCLFSWNIHLLYKNIISVDFCAHHLAILTSLFQYICRLNYYRVRQSLKLNYICSVYGESPDYFTHVYSCTHPSFNISNFTVVGIIYYIFSLFCHQYSGLLRNYHVHCHYCLSCVFVPVPVFSTHQCLYRFSAAQTGLLLALIRSPIRPYHSPYKSWFIVGRLCYFIIPKTHWVLLTISKVIKRTLCCGRVKRQCATYLNNDYNTYAIGVQQGPNLLTSFQTRLTIK